MVRKIEDKCGDKQLWIKIVDRTNNQSWEASPEWLKQHLGICCLKDTTEYLQKQIDELKGTVLHWRLPMARAQLTDAFKKSFQLNTREITNIIDSQPSKLDSNIMQVAFNQMVADGTLQFKSQGKGHPRLWFLKEG